MILISGLLGMGILILIWIIKALHDAPIIDDFGNEDERFFSEFINKEELDS